MDKTFYDLEISIRKGQRRIGDPKFMSMIRYEELSEFLFFILTLHKEGYIDLEYLKID